MIYTQEQRERIIAEAKGKTVESLEFVEKEPQYWVMAFTDGSEICFRFVSELVR